MRRLNRWVSDRQDKIHMKVALRRSRLSPEKIDRLLSACLNTALVGVGCITFHRGKFIGGGDWDQVTLILCCLADISSELPDERRSEIVSQIEQLTQHNWGGIRRAAETALLRLRQKATLQES